MEHPPATARLVQYLTDFPVEPLSCDQGIQMYAEIDTRSAGAMQASGTGNKVVESQPVRAHADMYM